MKRIFLSVALVCAALCAHAEWAQVIERDTMVWTNGVELEQTYKVNALGEKRVQRKAVLWVRDGEKKVQRKVVVNKATYEALAAGKQAWVVLSVYDDGSERITKVLTK